MLKTSGAEFKNYNKIILYYKKNTMNDLELLTVYNFNKKIRFGMKSHGGYVIADVDTVYDCYISAGVSNEESFSRDFINKNKMTKENSFAFDGTIDSYPTEFTEEITFTKKNIGPVDDDKNTNLKIILNSYSNIFIKMNIEGGEYEWINCLNSKELSNIGQLTIELHGITGDGWNTLYKNKVKCLEKLNNTHYIIHAHGNNFGPVINRIPDVIEITYLNKRFFNQTPAMNDKQMPMSVEGLDYPNLTSKPDINLSFYPFAKEVLTVFKKKVLIGFSNHNVKIIPSIVNDDKEYRVLLGDNNTNDKFEFRIKNRDLIVKRLDIDSGWGFDHTAIIYLLADEENDKNIVRDFSESQLTYRKLINVGNSTRVDKTIDISGNDEVIQVVLCGTNKPDRFTFKILGNYLLVTRRDKNEGWAYNHSVYIYKSTTRMKESDLIITNNKKLTELSLDTPIFYKKQIEIGTSDKYVKKIDISEILRNTNYKISLVTHKFSDTFNWKLEQNKLTITRTDKDVGWGYNHSAFLHF